MGCAATTARVHFANFKNRYIKLDNCVRRCGIIRGVKTISELVRKRAWCIWCAMAPRRVAVMCAIAMLLALSGAAKQSAPSFALTLRRAPNDEATIIAPSNAVEHSVAEAGDALRHEWKFPAGSPVEHVHAEVRESGDEAQPEGERPRSGGEVGGHCAVIDQAPLRHHEHARTERGHLVKQMRGNQNGAAFTEPADQLTRGFLLGGV